MVRLGVEKEQRLSPFLCQSFSRWSLILSTSDGLPHLEILPIEKLILHEYHDHQRTPPIIQSIKDDGKLRNPPVVVPLDDGSGRYVVLDGANRTTALRDMGVPHTIAQIVQMGDPGLELTSWNHLVWGISPDTLIDWVHTVPGLNLRPSSKDNIFRDLLDIRSLAMLHLADDRIYTVYTREIELVHRVRVLNALVNCYAKRTSMDRTLNYTIEPLESLYVDLCGLVLLPPFQLEDVLYLASQEHLMPTGSTRFTISGRALRVNFPLDILNNGQSLEQKSLWLQEWLQTRLSNKCVRYYAEPIFIFDE